MLNFNCGILHDEIVEQGEAMEMKGNCNCNCNYEIYISDKDISENKNLWDSNGCRLRYYLLQTYRA
jgi:hypothetical protein